MVENVFYNRSLKKTGDRIDVGCGRNPVPGFIGIDILDYGQDIVWDVRDGIPLPDGSVTQLHTCHFIEHLTLPEAGVFIKEILRVCKDGATVTIRCPHSGTEDAHYHNHMSLWSDRRIRGIVKGRLGSVKPGQRYFAIKSNEHVGAELIAVLKVKQK